MSRRSQRHANIAQKALILRIQAKCEQTDEVIRIKRVKISSYPITHACIFKWNSEIFFRVLVIKVVEDDYFPGQIFEVMSQITSLERLSEIVYNLLGLVLEMEVEVIVLDLNPVYSSVRVLRKSVRTVEIIAEFIHSIINQEDRIH